MAGLPAGALSFPESPEFRRLPSTASSTSNTATLVSPETPYPSSSAEIFLQELQRSLPRLLCCGRVVGRTFIAVEPVIGVVPKDLYLRMRGLHSINVLLRDV